MKLRLTPVGLVSLILLAIIGFALPDMGIGNNIFERGLPAFERNWTENYVDGAAPFENSFIKCFVKAGLLPTTHYYELAVRNVPPVWEKSLSEYVSYRTNFFRPIMVLIFFLFFYQSSRNSAEPDHQTVLRRLAI